MCCTNSLKREIELLKQLVAAKDALITELRLKSMLQINIPSVWDIKTSDPAPYIQNPREQDTWRYNPGPTSTIFGIWPSDGIASIQGSIVNPNK